MYQESIFHRRIKLFSAREPRNRSRNVCGNVETYLQLLFFCSVAAYCLIWYRFIVSAGRSPLTNIHHRKCRCVGVPLLHLGRSYISWHLLHKVPRYPRHLYQLPRHNRVASHIYLLAIMIYIIFTWQWSRNIFGHEELLLLVEEPCPVGVQLGDVDQVQLYRVFFPEQQRHSDSHLSFLLLMRHHQGHCTHMYDGEGRSCWGKYFQKQLQQHFTKKPRTTWSVSTKLPTLS